ncbi:hypothetical protein GCM10010106_03870 [Thermopolyspora flexuosa]|nr:hypothetical protein GCM10010106_03870 [Thermopolyspora flexuosa]
MKGFDMNRMCGVCRGCGGGPGGARPRRPAAAATAAPKPADALKRQFVPGRGVKFTQITRGRLLNRVSVTCNMGSSGSTAPA